MKPELNDGIAVDQRVLSRRWLNHILADTYVLYTKTRKFHWNVVGLQFMELHKHFESIYEMLDDQIDTLAERVRALDDVPLASLKEFIEEAEIKESSEVPADAKLMIEELVKDLEHLIVDTRKAANGAAKDNADMATNNMLIGFMESEEKTLWMLRSYLN